MNRRLVSIGAFGVAAGALLGACSLDERMLLPGGNGGSAGITGEGGSAAGSGGTVASAGGSGGGNGGLDGGAPATGSGGATDGGWDGVLEDTGGGGAGGAGGAGKDPCVYAGTVVVPGCETLVPNPGFANNAVGWEPEQPDVTVGWDAIDAQVSGTSGSLAVTNRVYANTDGTGMAGAGRCLPATGGLTYVFAAGLFIAAGQNQGSGAIGAFFFDSADCSGPVKKGIASAAETAEDSWKLIELQDSAPLSARSMLVRLATVKLFRQPSLIVRFDNVFVQGK